MGAFLKWLPPGSLTFKTLLFDVVTNEEHQFSSTVTEHPVEKGADISDHVRPNLDTVTLEVFVSNAPLGLPNTPSAGDGSEQVVSLSPAVYKPIIVPTPGGLLNAAASALSGLLAGQPDPVNAKAVIFPTETNYVAQTLEALRDLRDSAELVNVVTSEHYYDSMILKSVSLPRDKDSGTGGYFTLEFQQIRLVSSQVVSAPIPTLPRAVAPVAKGVKSPEDVPADSPKTSILRGLTDSRGVTTPGL